MGRPHADRDAESAAVEIAPIGVEVVVPFGSQPGPPFGAVVLVEQDDITQIRRPGEGMASTAEQQGTAGRGNGNRLQQRRPFGRPGPAAELDAKICIRHIYDAVIIRELDLTFDSGLVVAEGRNVLRQPFAREHRRAGDGEASTDLPHPPGCERCARCRSAAATERAKTRPASVAPRRARPSRRDRRRAPLPAA